MVPILYRKETVVSSPMKKKDYYSWILKPKSNQSHGAQEKVKENSNQEDEWSNLGYISLRMTRVMLSKWEVPWKVPFEESRL